MNEARRLWLFGWLCFMCAWAASGLVSLIPVPYPVNVGLHLGALIAGSLVIAAAADRITRRRP